MNEELTPLNDSPQQSTALLADLREIISRGNSQAVGTVNSALTITFWHVGKRINDDVLHGDRAGYGKQVIPFYTQVNTITSRWFDDAAVNPGSHTTISLK